MKKKLLSILGCLLIIAGCTKDEINPTTQDLKKINEAEETIDNYLEKLDSQKISKDEASKILCKDFPKDYTLNYVPAFLKVSKGYSKENLLKDMDNVIQHYTTVYGITCAD